MGAGRMASIFNILVGFVLLIYGIRGLLRKQIELGIGGRASGRPIVTVALSGVAGSIFSIVCIVGGAFVLLPQLYRVIDNQNADSLLMQTAAPIGLAIVIIGFVFACIVQLAMSFGGSVARQKNSNSHEDVSKEG